MRNVYHHFVHPAEIDASASSVLLKPGSLLAVIDFPPSKARGLIAPIRGAPGIAAGTAFRNTS
jgi:hypothetical protein